MSLALGITMAIKIKKYRSSKKEYLFSEIEIIRSINQ
jgi:hypothetical protein